MKLEPGDLVEIVAVPSRIDRVPAGGDRVPAPGDRLGEPELQVYRSCLGFKLAIVRVDDDGLCVFQLHQEWSHFPGIAPFDLRFDADCLRKIEPFGDAEWATLSSWMDSGAPISGEVIAVEGRLRVRLDGAMLGDLALPDEASSSDYLGKTIPVQIIMLNRKKRELVAYPVSP